MKIENSASAEFQKLPFFLKTACLIYGILLTLSISDSLIQINVSILQLIIKTFLAYHLLILASLLCLIIYFNQNVFYQLYNLKNLYLRLESAKKVSLKRFLIIILIMIVFGFYYKEIGMEKLFDFLNKIFHCSLDYNKVEVAIKQLIKTESWWVIILKAPILEEIMFRFCLFYSLKNFLGKYTAIILTTIIFSLAHSYNFSYIILTIPSSFIFVYLTHVFDSLIPSTILHIVTNTIAYFNFQ